MCIGIPARITAVEPGFLPMATVEVAGSHETRQCCLAYLPEAAVGSWVYIQSGFATVALSDDDAHAAIAALEELHDATKENGPCA